MGSLPARGVARMSVRPPEPDRWSAHLRVWRLRTGVHAGRGRAAPDGEAGAVAGRRGVGRRLPDRQGQGEGREDGVSSFRRARGLRPPRALSDPSPAPKEPARASHGGDASAVSSSGPDPTAGTGAESLRWSPSVGDSSCATSTPGSSGFARSFPLRCTRHSRQWSLMSRSMSCPEVIPAISAWTCRRLAASAFSRTLSWVDGAAGVAWRRGGRGVEGPRWSRCSWVRCSDGSRAPRVCRPGAFPFHRPAVGWLATSVRWRHRRCADRHHLAILCRSRCRARSGRVCRGPPPPPRPRNGWRSRRRNGRRRRGGIARANGRRPKDRFIKKLMNRSVLSPRHPSKPPASSARTASTSPTPRPSRPEGRGGCGAGRRVQCPFTAERRAARAGNARERFAATGAKVPERIPEPSDDPGPKRPRDQAAALFATNARYVQDAKTIKARGRSRTPCPVPSTAERRAARGQGGTVVLVGPEMPAGTGERSPESTICNGHYRTVGAWRRANRCPDAGG